MIYAGCDLGILAAKAALIDDGEILALELLPYRNHPREAAVEVLDKALATAGLSAEDIDYCIATGFGKRAVEYADGIMRCPLCLYLAVREIDRDIICLCEYRTSDVEAYGSCYCNLYVSKEWNEGKIPNRYVPERRPPEKMF